MADLISVHDCPCDGCKAKPCGHPAKCVKFALWLNKTVDAVEVKHGRWDKNWSGDNIVYCNQCYMPQDVPTPYCASCGANMDGE